MRVQLSSEEALATFAPTNEMLIMPLADNLAQQIVAWIATSFDVKVSVADPSARILASTDPSLVGRSHPLATHALMSSASNADDLQHTGVSLPIVAANAIVGAVVIDDSSPRGKAIAAIAKTLAELLIRQMTVIDPL